jgi:hypothetical protein
MTLVLSAVSVVRDESGEMDLGSHLAMWGAVYHSTGFVILDQELRDPDGILRNEISFGRATFSGLERYGVLLLRRFDRSVVPIASVTGTYLDRFRPIGTLKDGSEIVGNAFATGLFYLYLDGREVGVLLGSVGFGLLLGTYFRTWRTYSYTTDFAIVLSLTLGGWLSVFQGQFDSARYWALILVCVLLQSVTGREPKPPTAQSLNAATDQANRRYTFNGTVFAPRLR